MDYFIAMNTFFSCNDVDSAMREREIKRGRERERERGEGGREEGGREGQIVFLPLNVP